eukprot:753531-Hanusia_phi.AAC.1
MAATLPFDAAQCNGTHPMTSSVLQRIFLYSAVIISNVIGVSSLLLVKHSWSFEMPAMAAFFPRTRRMEECTSTPSASFSILAHNLQEGVLVMDRSHTEKASTPGSDLGDFNDKDSSQLLRLLVLIVLDERMELAFFHRPARMPLLAKCSVRGKREPREGTAETAICSE